MVEMARKQQLMSKRRYLVLLFQRMEDPKLSHDEFIRMALIAERHSKTRWNRKRRSSDEVALEQIIAFERQQRAKGTQ